jgi:hypothetical protein
MCFDPTRKSIYVLGRYVEFRPSTTPPEHSLYESEFYQYFIELDRWIKISENTQVKVRILEAEEIFFSLVFIKILCNLD